MYGIDVSGWQQGLKLKNAPLDFVIMKATEGSGLTDKAFHDFAVQSTELGLLQGVYHFARPDLHPTKNGMIAEAEYFLKAVQNEGLLGKAILVLDWETEPIDRPDLIEAWVDTVELYTTVTPFIYGSKSKLMSKTFDSFRNSYPIWMAAWPSTSKIHNCRPAPYIISKDKLKWDIWQFSANGTWPGFSGAVDCNYTDIDEKKWRFYAEIVKKPSAGENLSDPMKWAVDRGLFIGYEDGKYHPEKTVTREQLATVLYRYNKLYSK